MKKRIVQLDLIRSVPPGVPLAPVSTRARLSFEVWNERREVVEASGYDFNAHVPGDSLRFGRLFARAGVAVYDARWTLGSGDDEVIVPEWANRIAWRFYHDWIDLTDRRSWMPLSRRVDVLRRAAEDRGYRRLLRGREFQRMLKAAVAFGGGTGEVIGGVYLAAMELAAERRGRAAQRPAKVAPPTSSGPMLLVAV